MSSGSDIDSLSDFIFVSISDDIVRVLRERVASLEGLEVLLALRTDRARAWSIVEVAERLSLPDGAIEPTLAELVQQGLVVREGSGPGLRWRFAPDTPQLDALIDRLALAYDERKLEVMRLLSAHAMERIRNAAARAFADAFVIWRKKDG
jgi:DNA-binding MarR family transcriptional regulator